MTSKKFLMEDVESLGLYQCHKQVRAAKIKNIVLEKDHVVLHLVGKKPVSVPNAWQEKHGAAKGGYLVVYKDGYTSYSPEYAFESGYFLIEENSKKVNEVNENSDIITLDTVHAARELLKENAKASREVLERVKRQSEFDTELMVQMQGQNGEVKVARISMVAKAPDDDGYFLFMGNEDGDELIKYINREWFFKHKPAAGMYYIIETDGIESVIGDYGFGKYRPMPISYNEGKEE